ncbi:MAG: hypothetical protein D6785_12720, partial [Planctomycetota bacterium]
DIGTLKGLLPSFEVTRENLAKEFSTLRNKVDKDSVLEKEIKQKEKELENLPSPNLEKIEKLLKSRIPSVRDAEKQVQTTLALMEYQKKRVELLKKLIEYRKKKENLLEKLLFKGKEYYRHLKRYLVLVEYLYQLKEEGKAKGLENLPLETKGFHLETELEEIRKQIQEWKAEKSKNLLSSLEKSLKEGEEEILNLNKKLEEQNKVYQEELAWAKWILDAERLSKKELFLKWKETQSQWKKTVEKKKQEEENLKKLLSDRSKIREEEESLDHPLVLKALKVLEKLRKKSKDKVQKIHGEKNYAITLEILEEEEKEILLLLKEKLFLFSQEKSLDKIWEQKLDLHTTLFRFYEENLKIKGKEKAKIEEIIGSLNQLSQISLEELRLLKKLYGLAQEFQLRMGQNKISSKEIPEEIKAFAQRDSIQKGEEQAEGLKKEQEKWQKEKDRLSSQIQLQQRLKKYLDIRIFIITKKISLIREEKKWEAKLETPFEKWKDIEKKRLLQEVSQRMYDQSVWYEILLAHFYASKIKEYNDILEEYYRELLVLEQKELYLKKRIRINQKLIGQIQEEIQLLRKFQKDVERENQRVFLENLAQRAEWEIFFKPSSFHEAIIKRVQERIPLFSPHPPSGLSISQIREKLFQSYGEDATYSAWQASLEWELSKIGLENEIGRLQESIARLEARIKQLQPEKENLLGHGRTSWLKLSEEEKRDHAGQSYLFIYGDIGQMKRLRMQKMIRALLESLMSLFLIPLLALVLIRLANRIGNKIISHVQDENAKKLDKKAEKEREKRAETLVSVFNAAWAGVVIVVSSIYLLKQLNIDITPIIASAGVVGLAIAFGAQSLIKDYFAGFFILLENQYSVGDIVEIGGIGGKVEKITLRLTKIRDLDGNVHYFPNGSITTVSNKSQLYSWALVEVGVAYDSDLDYVFNALSEMGKNMKDDPDVGEDIFGEFEILGVSAFADSSINIRMRIKTVPGKQFKVSRKMRKRIKEVFDQKGITIPFPQRVVHYAKEEEEKKDIPPSAS